MPQSAWHIQVLEEQSAYSDVAVASEPAQELSKTSMRVIGIVRALIFWPVPPLRAISVVLLSTHEHLPASA